MGDGGLRHLPGGIDQYVALRREAATAAPAAPRERAVPSGAARLRATRKEVQRLEREIERVGAREADA